MEGILDEVVEAFAVYVPRIVGAIALAALGLVLAVVAKRVTPFMLRRLRFDRVCESVGITSLSARAVSAALRRSSQAWWSSTPPSRSRSSRS
jgi:Conserved TM helix